MKDGLWYGKCCTDKLTGSLGIRCSISVDYRMLLQDFKLNLRFGSLGLGVGVSELSSALRGEIDPQTRGPNSA